MELSTEILGNIGKTVISIEFTTKHVVICHDDPRSLDVNTARKAYDEPLMLCLTFDSNIKVRY